MAIRTKYRTATGSLVRGSCFFSSPGKGAVETGFVAYLCFKQAYAVARGADRQAEMCTCAERHFIDYHLRVLADPLAKSLAVSGIAYLARAGEALRRRAGGPLPGPSGPDPGAE